MKSVSDSCTFQQQMQQGDGAHIPASQPVRPQIIAPEGGGASSDRPQTVHRTITGLTPEEGKTSKTNLDGHLFLGLCATVAQFSMLVACMAMSHLLSTKKPVTTHRLVVNPAYICIYSACQ